MKNLHLILAIAMMSISTLALAEFRPIRHRMEDPVKIKVRDVDFYIFPNGEFDFNAHQRHNRRGGYYQSYGVRVERDRSGKIRRVGNVYINYNRYAQVSRIGNVFIRYNRRGFIEKIGRKRLRYHRGGYVVINGYYEAYPSYAYSSTYYGGADAYQQDVYAYNDSSWNTSGYDYDNTGSDDVYYRSHQSKNKNKKVKVKVRNRR